MSELELGVEARPQAAPVEWPRAVSRNLAIGILVWLLLLGNVAAIVWLWWHGGNVTGVHDAGGALTSAARITGLLGAYCALLQVVLLARIPWLERLAGFDRLTHWHRLNGWAYITLVVAHVFTSVWGYALLDKYSIGKEISTMLRRRHLPGDDHRHGRDRADDRRRRDLGRDAPAASLRGVVRRPPRGVRGNRARVVPSDPDR
jgi:hypothetical protein